MSKDDLLLYNLEDMHTKTVHYTPLSCGSTPYNRSIKEYLKYSVVNLDKPVNPSSHEVVSWIKKIMGCEKTGHGGTLDPQVSGTLLVCIDRATRLTKSMQSEGKTYICTIAFSDRVQLSDFKKVAETLTGKVFQRPPLMSAVKRQLRVREIYSIDVMEQYENDILFLASCEAGTYIRTLCIHMGLLLGVKAHMKDLRRIRTGHFTEYDSVTMHDILDAIYLLNTRGDESVVRKVFQPLEVLLKGYKRIMVKDSCVGALCAGAQLTINGIVKYEKEIEIGDEIVLMTTKGEAVALAAAKISSVEIGILEHGIVCKTKRVIMDKGVYPETWGFKKAFEVQE